jgi:hypothetical protein
MPRRIIARSVDVHLDLRQGPKTAERQRWMDRRLRQHHLSKPLTQLEARGVCVPKPPPNSQGAIVKWWTANVHTTGMHTHYLRQARASRGRMRNSSIAMGPRIGRPSSTACDRTAISCAA